MNFLFDSIEPMIARHESTRTSLQRVQRTTPHRASFNSDFYVLGVFSLVLVLIILNACAPPDEKPIGPEAPGAQKIVSTIRATVVPLPEPNRYEVLLEWVRSADSRAWLLHRGESPTERRQLATLSPELTEFRDSGVSAGKSFHYELGTLEEGGYVSKGKVAVVVPRDLEVKGQLETFEIKDYRRLFLSSGSKIISGGRNATINVEEIISDNGSIESFPEGQTAGASTTGRNGGTIVIRSKSGRGTLHILARGERGGHGMTGTGEASAGAKGPIGNDGACGRDDAEFNCREVNRFYLDLVRNEPQRAGLTPEAARRYLEKFSCRIQTGDGGAGSPGHVGSKGGTGLPGGDAAKVYVRIAEPTHLKVLPNSLPGPGGVGGQGGKGGPGGPGGEPGQPDHLGLCRNGNSGPPGPEGSRGPQGEAGPAGKPQPICLELGDVALGDCAAFQSIKEVMQ